MIVNLESRVEDIEELYHNYRVWTLWNQFDDEGYLIWAIEAGFLSLTEGYWCMSHAFSSHALWRHRSEQDRCEMFACESLRLWILDEVAPNRQAGRNVASR